MSATNKFSIHRHLDQAFAGVDLTPELQDLKEELRGSLTSRVDELVATGTSPATASTKAVKELGDIGALIASIEPSSGNDLMELMARNRVRPNPGFVVAAVLLSLVLASSITGTVLASLGLATIGILASSLAAVSVGALVAVALRQETSQDYPMPTGRALGFGLASFATLFGLGFITLFIGDAVRGGAATGLLIIGVVAAVLGIVGFSWLGATLTNRAKPWALELRRGYESNDHFTQHPEAAARFGLYTVIIWVLGIALFVVLSITVGFLWSWLALVAALAIFFLVLARMLFPAGSSSTEKGN
jgi:NADH:ubiquinone oxidoreductase subunit 3 (subunit A)